MRRTVFRVLLVFVAVLALLSVFGLWQAGKTPVVKAESLINPPAQKPDNSQCLGCHSTPDQVFTFPNGDTVSILVEPGMYGGAVHSNLACQVCHTNISGYPHPENTAASAHEYTRQYKDTCAQCHPNQVKDISGSAHYKLAEQGNPNTPVCADCHDPHVQVKIAKDANGDPAPSEHVTIAGICSQCHSQIVEQYQQSVHGKAVMEDNNPDVPACDQCHGVHNISQARTVEFRLNSPNLCATCHTNEAMMSKYGISTQVLNTYVSDFHGTTVTLFEKTSPEHVTNKPVCYDCHGVHSILRVDDPNKGLQVKENMLVACQRCHPDASTNFSESWMSHYIPDAQRTPLVFYVDLFYRIFVPGVLGGMAVFVVADIYGKIRHRGKHGAGSTPQTGAKE